MSGDPGEDYDPYDDVPEWTEEDEERYQARRHEELRRRRRRRRQGCSFAVLVLLVLGAGVAGAGISQGWWEWPFGRDAGAEASPGSSPDCSQGATTVSLPADVQVTVLNATDVRGLAATVAAELQERGYVVAGIGNDESGVDVPESAQVRYGPALVADAQSVALNVPGAVLVDDGRTSDVVDLVLGAGYGDVAPAEQAAAAIAAAAPPQCAPSATPSPTSTG